MFAKAYRDSLTKNYHFLLCRPKPVRLSMKNVFVHTRKGNGVKEPFGF